MTDVASTADFASACEAETIMLAELRGLTALLVHRRRCVLTLAAYAPPPESGTLLVDGNRRAWRALSWPAPDHGGYAGVALVDEPLFAPATTSWRLEPADAATTYAVVPPTGLDLAPGTLADYVAETGGEPGAVFDLLINAAAGAGEEIADATIDFAKRFMAATARQDGFIEIVAAPEGGGLFVQGWSMSLAAGDHAVTDLAAQGVAHPLVVARFDRDDILPPGTGFCGFSKDVRAPVLDTMNALFVETTERGLLRFDLTPSAARRLSGDEAVQHIRATLPRLDGPENVWRAFKRICRPRYTGENTLAACERPIALALDTALRAPRGDLFLQGWLLDPGDLVDRVVVKSTAAGYAPLNDRWVRLPRPDLDTAFKDDPRFRGRLGRDDGRHGFAAAVPASALPLDATADPAPELYVEIVFKDEACVFMPFAPVPCDDLAALVPSLEHFHEQQPTFEPIVRQHLRPFVDGVPKPGAANVAADPPPASAETRPTVSVLMPLRRATDLPPVLSALSGTPEAAAMELLVVAGGDVAGGLRRKFDRALDFYDLAGRLVEVAEARLETDKLARAARLATGSLLLVWRPTVLPTAPGWLAPLLADYAAVDGPALLSPTLIFEDGSVAYGGDCDGGGGADTVPRFSGYGANWLPDTGPRPVGCGAKDFFLLSRSTLELAGGLQGAMVSDAYAHIDLAQRLAATGGRCFWTGSATLWSLDDGGDDERAGWPAVARHLDAAVLDERARLEVPRGQSATVTELRAPTAAPGRPTPHGVAQ